MLSTIEYARQLAECFELNIKERSLLFTACALHNIGHLNGKTLHAQTGAEMAKGFLRKKNVASEDVKIIGSAIASHTGRRGDNFYDNVSFAVVIFASSEACHAFNHYLLTTFLGLPLFLGIFLI